MHRDLTESAGRDRRDHARVPADVHRESVEWRRTAECEAAQIQTRQDGDGRRNDPERDRKARAKPAEPAARSEPAGRAARDNGIGLRYEAAQPVAEEKGTEDLGDEHIPDS